MYFRKPTAIQRLNALMRRNVEFKRSRKQAKARRNTLLVGGLAGVGGLGLAGAMLSGRRKSGGSITPSPSISSPSPSIKGGGATSSPSLSPISSPSPSIKGGGATSSPQVPNKKIKPQLSRKEANSRRVIERREKHGEAFRNIVKSKKRYYNRKRVFETRERLGLYGINGRKQELIENKKNYYGAKREARAIRNNLKNKQYNSRKEQRRMGRDYMRAERDMLNAQTNISKIQKPRPPVNTDSLIASYLRANRGYR